MRKRWHVSDELLPLLGGIWLLGWLPIGIVIGALTTPCDSTGACGMDSSAPGLHPYGIFLMVWFGIVVVPVVGAGLGVLGGLLWESRPRRVIEPVTEDLRAREKR